MGVSALLSAGYLSGPHSVDSMTFSATLEGKMRRIIALTGTNASELLLYQLR